MVRRRNRALFQTRVLGDQTKGRLNNVVGYCCRRQRHAHGAHATQLALLGLPLWTTGTKTSGWLDSAFGKTALGSNLLQHPFAPMAWLLKQALPGPTQPVALLASAHSRARVGHSPATAPSQCTRCRRVGHRQSHPPVLHLGRMRSKKPLTDKSGAFFVMVGIGAPFTGDPA